MVTQAMDYLPNRRNHTLGKSSSSSSLLSDSYYNLPKRRGMRETSVQTYCRDEDESDNDVPSSAAYMKRPRAKPHAQPSTSGTPCGRAKPHAQPSTSRIYRAPYRSSWQARIEDDFSESDSSGLSELPLQERLSSVKQSSKRRDYTRKEGLSIVQFIISNAAYSFVKGRLLWEKMEKEAVCDRTWQSMKEHFLKKILPNIDNYDVDTAESLLFQNSTEQDSLDNSNGSIGQIPPGRRGWRRKVKFYTREEDQKILEFIIRTKRYAKVNGNELWKRMECRNTVPGRTWQSLKERYRKVILPRLEEYGLTEDIIDKLKHSRKAENLTKSSSQSSRSQSHPRNVCARTSQPSTSPKSTIFRPQPSKSNIPRQPPPKSITPRPQSPKSSNPSSQPPKPKIPSKQLSIPITPRSQAPKSSTLRPQSPKSSNPSPQPPKPKIPSKQLSIPITPRSQAPKSSTPSPQSPKSNTPNSQPPESNILNQECPKSNTLNLQSPILNTGISSNCPVSEAMITISTDHGECRLIENRTSVDVVVGKDSSTETHMNKSGEPIMCTQQGVAGTQTNDTPTPNECMSPNIFPSNQSYLLPLAGSTLNNISNREPTSEFTSNATVSTTLSDVSTIVLDHERAGFCSKTQDCVHDDNDNKGEEKEPVDEARSASSRDSSTEGQSLSCVSYDIGKQELKLCDSDENAKQEHKLSSSSDSEGSYSSGEGQQYKVSSPEKEIQNLIEQMFPQEDITDCGSLRLSDSDSDRSISIEADASYPAACCAEGCSRCTSQFEDLSPRSA